MDRFLEILYMAIPYLHLLAGLAVIIKAVIVFRNKGFNVPALFTSFFRIYSKSDFYMSSNQHRRQFMRMNNYLNYYIYGWLIATFIVIVVFQSVY